MGKQHVAILFCITALLILVVSFSRSCGSESAVASEAEWICLGCGHVYTFTEKALEAHYRDHYGEPLSCPECDGLEVEPATQCTQCEEFFARPARGNRCPHCDRPLDATP